jgi:hypothetical protein
VAEFKAYLATQEHLVTSEYLDGADMSQSHYETISEFWGAIEAANPIGLRAPCVVCGHDDEDVSEDLCVHLDWSRGRAWLWFSVHQSGKCSITYRNFETDEEVLAEWPTLAEALPPCLTLVCKHLGNRRTGARRPRR